MKYAKFSDDFLSDFRLDDNGETLVLTDKRGFTRAVRLLPYEERPQGSWMCIDDPDDPDDQLNRYRCSECGRIIKIYDWQTFADYPYCQCGAKMKGDKEE